MEWGEAATGSREYDLKEQDILFCACTQLKRMKGDITMGIMGERNRCFFYFCMREQERRRHNKEESYPNQ
jgi:hypothetical protein